VFAGFVFLGGLYFKGWENGEWRMENGEWGDICTASLVVRWIFNISVLVLMSEFVWFIERDLRYLLRLFSL